MASARATSQPKLCDTDPKAPVMVRVNPFFASSLPVYLVCRYSPRLDIRAYADAVTCRVHKQSSHRKQ